MKLLRCSVVLAAIAVLGLFVVLTPSLSAQGPSHEWIAAETNDLTLWHTQGEIRAEDLANHGQGAYDLVGDLLEVSIDQRLALIVWPQGGDPSDASAWPEGIEDDWLVLHVMRNASGDVRNSVTNALISAAAAPHADQVPLWMRSAMGFWSQGPLPGFYLRRAGSVILFDHEDYYSFEQLETIPTTWQFQAKYFGQAGGMLAWMIQDWGTEALAELFRLTGSSVPFYDALEQVYGIPQEKFIDEFTGNAERALLLLWPYIEPQDRPFYETLNLNHVIMIAAAIPLAILFFFIGKRLFYD